MVAVHVVVIMVPVDVIIGARISIRSTVANVSHVFPARSSNVKRDDPLSVKICHVSFCPVRVSLNQVSIATTLQLVRLPEAGAYSIVAVGGSLSIQVTVAVSAHVFP